MWGGGGGGVWGKVWEGADERWMDLGDILEGESTMLADGLTMGILIIFYYKNTNSSFQCFSPPGTLPIFSTSGPGH